MVQAVAVVHHGLMSSAPLPHDPSHVSHARYIVEQLNRSVNGDSTLTLCGAYTICGYLNNKASSHCTPNELVMHALTSLHYIVESFKGPAAVMGIAPGPQQEPQTAVPPPVPQPVPTFPEPTTPLEVPDFS